MKKHEFDSLIDGLRDALSYAEGDVTVGARAHKVRVDRTFADAPRPTPDVRRTELAKPAVARRRRSWTA
jgi:putative transcriptional regulator